MPVNNIPILELKKVSRIFTQGTEELEVLKSVSLTINSGELVAIVGQSGSGKTTLMNILGCLDRPSRGEYHVKGRNIATLTPDELSALRRDVFGFVFQRYNLLAGSTASENVEMPALYANLDSAKRKARAADLLGRLGLTDRLGYKPAQLSGGQQQRVSIARALMNGGDVILADEPTGALDKNSGVEVLNLLAELHAAGHTVILITHDSSVAARAKRVITISDGEIISDVTEGANANAPAGNAAIVTDSESTPASTANAYVANNTSATATKKAAIKSTAAGKGAVAGRNGSAPSRLPFSAAFSMSLRALKDNRFRTLLTLLGIIIGVASVVTMLALGNGAKAKVLSTIESMGSDLISIRPMGGSSRSASGSVRLVDEDITALLQLPGVQAAVGETNGSVSVRYQEADYKTSYTATGTFKPVVANWALAKGEFFNAEDVRNSSPVVVIGQTVVDNIFAGGIEPVGKYIMIQNVPFLVIGVMSVKGASFMGSDQDDVLLVPVTTARLRLMGRHYLNSAVVKAAPGADMDKLQADMEQLMLERHGSQEVRVFNTASILEAANESQDTLTLLLGSVAAISLLVGGIGVMNIMLVSVIERTREIGVRMACGARQRDIMTQFITEATMVCSIGGFLGLGFGVLVAFIASYYGAPVQYSLSPMVLAFSSAFATGLIFGFAPARKAARLDPVAALASE